MPFSKLILPTHMVLGNQSLFALISVIQIRQQQTTLTDKLSCAGVMLVSVGAYVNGAHSGFGQREGHGAPGEQ